MPVKARSALVAINNFFTPEGSNQFTAILFHVVRPGCDSRRPYYSSPEPYQYLLSGISMILWIQRGLRMLICIEMGDLDRLKTVLRTVPQYLGPAGQWAHPFPEPRARIYRVLGTTEETDTLITKKTFTSEGPHNI